MTERTECWQCGYMRPIFEACPDCGVYGGESPSRKTTGGDQP